MARILVVDDEPRVLDSFRKLLGRRGHDVRTARRAEEALATMETDPPEVVVMDIRLPGMDGLEAIRRLRSLHGRLPVIVMTGHSTTETAIEAMKLGAFDYQVKPFEPPEMLGAIDRALEGVRLMQRQVALDPETVPVLEDALVGQSAGMREVYKMIGRVAQTDATVLIQGETGTGKELVARAIYQHSKRHGSPMLVVNCVVIPETLLESELFGHERGAFTGATSRHIGKFERAAGGTLFLDEIGDISTSVQAKILRVLQEKTFERVGGNEPLRADVRVLAATNRDLEKGITDGTFREDLYHRLNVVRVRIPPLRERAGDIRRLADYFLARFSRELGIDRPLLSPEALAVLERHRWPGNVRELEHCVQRAVIVTQGYPLQAQDVERALRPPEEPPSSEASEAGLLAFVREYLRSYNGPSVHAAVHDLLDRLIVGEALRMSGGNQTRAARLLGLSRQTLQDRMHKHGLGRPGGPAGCRMG